MFDSVDFVMTPTAPRAWYAKRDAPAARTDGSALEIGRFTAVFNLTGNPAITLPCGTTPDGFPVGVQFAGRRLADRELIAFATRFEAATPHGARPPSFD